MQYIHNPKCSKSRQALALLEDNGYQPDIRLYLEDPLSKSELVSICQKLEVEPRELIRPKELKDLGVDSKQLSPEKSLDLMAEHPKLIERPIFVVDQKAVVGRPPETVLTLI